LSLAGLDVRPMCGQVEDRRIRGIARQICLLKSEMRKESKKNIVLFLLGLTVGLLVNVLVGLLIL